MMNSPLCLETERLKLRRLTTDDAPFMLELLNEPDFIKYIRDSKVRDLAAARTHIESGPLASYQQHGYGLLLVELKQSGAALGVCGLLKRDSLADPDIGFAMLARHRGWGYAYEASRAVLQWGLEHGGMTRIAAITSLENPRSAALLNKLGFRFESVVQLGEDAERVRLFAYP